MLLFLALLRRSEDSAAAGLREPVRLPPFQLIRDDGQPAYRPPCRAARRRRGWLPRLAALRDQRAGDSGKDVTRSSGGQCGVTRRIDNCFSVRCGDDGSRSFQNRDSRKSQGQFFCSFEPVGLNGVTCGFQKSCRFQRVRCDDRRGKSLSGSNWAIASFSERIFNASASRTIGLRASIVLMTISLAAADLPRPGPVTMTSVEKSNWWAARNMISGETGSYAGGFFR